MSHKNLSIALFAVVLFIYFIYYMCMLSVSDVLIGELALLMLLLMVTLRPSFKKKKLTQCFVLFLKSIRLSRSILKTDCVPMKLHDTKA